MYAEHELNGTQAVAPLLTGAQAALMGSALPPNLAVSPTLSLNATVLAALQGAPSGTTVPVVFYNTLSWAIARPVQLPAFQTNLIVRNATGAVVASDLLPADPEGLGPCSVRPPGEWRDTGAQDAYVCRP